MASVEVLGLARCEFGPFVAHSRLEQSGVEVGGKEVRDRDACETSLN